MSNTGNGPQMSKTRRVESIPYTLAVPILEYRQMKAGESQGKVGEVEVGVEEIHGVGLALAEEEVLLVCVVESPLHACFGVGGNAGFFSLLLVTSLFDKDASLLLIELAGTDAQSVQRA